MWRTDQPLCLQLPAGLFSAPGFAEGTKKWNSSHSCNRNAKLDFTLVLVLCTKVLYATFSLHPVKLNLNGRLLKRRLRWPCFTGQIKINKIFIYRLCFQALEARNQIQLTLVHNQHMYAPASAHKLSNFTCVPLITNNSSCWCASVLVHTSAECMVLLLNRALMLLIICRVFMMKLT